MVARGLFITVEGGEGVGKSTNMAFLETHLRKWPLSARGYTRILKVARTLADLDGSDKLNEKHIQRAVMFRTLDRGALHDLGGQG